MNALGRRGSSAGLPRWVAPRRNGAVHQLRVADGGGRTAETDQAISSGLIKRSASLSGSVGGAGQTPISARGPAARSRHPGVPRRRKRDHPRHLRQEPRELDERAPVLPGRSRHPAAPRRRRRDHPPHLGSAGPGRGPSRRCRLRSGRWPPAEEPRTGKAANGAWQGPWVIPPSWERNLGLAAPAVHEDAPYSWSSVVDGLNLGTVLSALPA